MNAEQFVPEHKLARIFIIYANEKSLLAKENSGEQIEK